MYGLVKAQGSRHCESVGEEYVGETILREEGKFWKKVIRSSTIGDGDYKEE